MSYSLKNISSDYRNAVSQLLLNTNWDDVANKIAEKELDKDYMVERFSGVGVSNESMQFAITKLEEAKKKIKGVTKKSRVQYVIGKIKQKLRKNISVGSEGGTASLTTFGVQNISQDGKSGAMDFLERLFSTTPTTPTTPTIQSPILPLDNTEDEEAEARKKRTNRILIGVGIGVGVILVGTVTYLALRKK